MVKYFKGFLLGFFLLNGGCATDQTGGEMFRYEQALERTDPAKRTSFRKGSVEEKEALDQFSDFFSIFSKENILQKVGKVYAKDAYFNDTLKEVEGREAIEAHFLKSAEGTEETKVEIKDIAESQGNYYVRWVMDIKFKSLKKGQTCRSIGMTHLRFNESGEIIFHQDYWDSAQGFFQHIPIVGYLIHKIKARI